jgi:hypothetical protein
MPDDIQIVRRKQREKLRSMGIGQSKARQMAEDTVRRVDERRERSERNGSKR